MTYEQMLEQLKAIRSDYDDDIKRYPMLTGYMLDAEALDMAIKLLSAQPEKSTTEEKSQLGK